MKRVSNLINKIRGKRDSLHLVVEAGNKEAVEVLLNKGADVNMINRNGKAPLYYAARSGRKEIVDVLLNNRADVNMGAVDVIGRTVNTPLHLAAEFGHKEVAEVLLNNGANVNMTDEIERAPLHYAAKFGHKEVAEVLLNNGANVNMIDETGGTPLHCAARSGYEGVAEVLLNNGANVNMIDKAEKTPLHYTAGFGREKMAGVFLSNIDIMDLNRQAPPHIITSLGDMCSSNNILFLRGIHSNPERFQGLTEAEARSLSKFPEELTVLSSAGFDFTKYVSNVDSIIEFYIVYSLFNTSSEGYRIQQDVLKLMDLNVKYIIACDVIFGSYEIRKNLEQNLSTIRFGSTKYYERVLNFWSAFEKKFRPFLLERAEEAILKFRGLEGVNLIAQRILEYLSDKDMRSLIGAALTGGGVVEEALKDIKDSREKIIVKLKRPVEQNMAALHTGEYTPPYSGEAVSFSRDESYEEGAVALPSYFDQMNIGASGSASQVDNQPDSRMSDVNTENFRVGRGSSVGWRPF
ncbi:MAG: ankyrin repeat domain-containing protein [Wolbachia endosymbiont of Armadillidium vulgare]